jgi:diphthamide biosynthesis protein 7
MTLHNGPEVFAELCSYDNTVRIFDLRKANLPVTSTDVGGGAWRVKWHPEPARKTDLLVACMHDGFKILQFDHDHETEFLAKGITASRFEEHQSLAYGVDWSFAESNCSKNTTLIASCSFYDYALCLWRG